MALCSSSFLLSGVHGCVHGDYINYQVDFRLDNQFQFTTQGGGESELATLGSVCEITAMRVFHDAINVNNDVKPLCRQWVVTKCPTLLYVVCNHWF